MERTEGWIIDYLSQKHDLAKYDKAKLHELNYLEEGLIDSFGIIELVMKIENHFNIKFPNDAFQDRKFSTIGGLAEIIEGQKVK